MASLPQSGASFIGYDRDQRLYAAYLSGDLVGRFPCYLSAEAAIERARIDQAAQDEADADRLDADRWLQIQPGRLQLVPAPGSELARAQRAADELFAA